MKKICSIHKLIPTLKQILQFSELKSHAHFWPRPPKNHWSNFLLSWICNCIEKICLLHLYNLEIQSILESVTRLATPIFDHTHPKIFWSTCNLYEFVSTCKKSGYFIYFFWRYGWLRNTAIWLAENILAHISRKKISPKMGLV